MAARQRIPPDYEGEYLGGIAIQGNDDEYNTVAICGAESNGVFIVVGELYFTDVDVVKDASGNAVGNIGVCNNEVVFVDDNILGNSVQKVVDQLLTK